MVVCEMEVRILAKRSGAKSRHNMKTGDRRSWEAKGSEGNGRVRTKRRKGETEVEPRIPTDRVFARSVFYIPRGRETRTRTVQGVAINVNYSRLDIFMDVCRKYDYS